MKGNESVTIMFVRPREIADAETSGTTEVLAKAHRALSSRSGRTTNRRAIRLLSSNPPRADHHTDEQLNPP